MLRRRLSLVSLTAAAALAALVAVEAVPARSEAGSTKVRVVLKEWKLLTSARTVRAGKVTFEVVNDGTMKHELVVLRTDSHHHAVPVRGGVAIERGLRGEVRPFAPGVTRTMTVRLKRGKYVLLCNLLGHYMAGQYAALRVR
jgi:uncharacterized cupredoxin-like copper-binding protein